VLAPVSGNSARTRLEPIMPSIFPLDSFLPVRDAEGVYRPVHADEVLRAAQRVLGEQLRGSDALHSPQAARDFLRVKLGALEHEVFAVLMLDVQRRLIAYVELFRGSVAQAAVYPREVVKEALAHNAAALILVHNHPSGVAQPSRADEVITQTLKSALNLVDVRVLDHLIVAGNDVVSMAECGLL
jgi:DNA repair protein RadC